MYLYNLPTVFQAGKFFPFPSRGNLHGDQWEECDSIVLFRGKVYIPLDGQFRHDIVEAHHDTPVTGHPGCWMTELVACNYWWPGMGHYIAKYMKGCDLCNHTKAFPNGSDREADA